MTKRPRFKRETVTRDLTVADAISGFTSDIEDLANEMREAFDNTPESLQSSGVGEARGEAADALENIQEPDVPEALGQLTLKHTTRTVPPREQSRSWRRDEAVSLLEAAIARLDEVEEGDPLHEEASQLSSDLDSLKSEAEDVQFPGMFG